MSEKKICIGVLDSNPSVKVHFELLKSDKQLTLLEIPDVRALHEAASEKKFDALLVQINDEVTFLHSIIYQCELSQINCPMVVIVGQGQVNAALEAKKLGAGHIFPLPVQMESLQKALAEIVSICQKAGFTCDAEASRQLLALSNRVAKTDVTVLINGESGTGKEVLANYVHNHSLRAHEPFVAINCASIPESMLEDMLFGHEKGAFTGAHQRHIGLFEQANKGTLFLDEIGEMPLILQSKILRVIQERELRRLGGTELVKLDVRLITATNRNLAERVRDREFREDLYYRLNVFPLKILPLRERIEDVLPIATTLIEKYQGAVNKNIKLSTAAEQFFMAYPWPGNVRELENVIQRAMVLAADGVIDVDHLLLEDPANLQINTPILNKESDIAGQPVISDLGVSVVEEKSSDDAEALSDLTWKSESKVILDTLKRFSGNRKNTAEKLGISPRTLRYKIAKLKDEGLAIP